MKTITFLCILLAAGSLSAGGQEPARLSGADLSALLGRIEKAFSKIRTLEAPFTQEKHLAIFTDAPKSEGFCLFARPDRVRIEITKPFRSALIANGKSVAKYEWAGSQWKKLSLGNTDAVLLVTRQVAAWLEGRFEENESIYDISAAVGKEVTLYLTPKSEKMRSFLKTIEVQNPADLSGIESIKLLEPGGDYTKMVFRNAKQNVPLPDAAFDTSLAAGIASEPWEEEASGAKGAAGTDNGTNDEGGESHK